MNGKASLDVEKKFSIIVPVYNVEAYLERCVESVLSQTYENFELVLVDDGSTDKSGAMCDMYALKDRRIKCVHRKNGGLSAARNTGLLSASGENIIFLDSDDMWNDAGALGELAKIFEEKPETEVIAFGYMLFGTDGKKRKNCIPEFVPSDCTEKEEVLKRLCKNNGFFNAAYTKALKKDFLINNKLFFEDGILSEDISWSGKILIKAHHFAVYPSGFYSYMLRKSGSITSSFGRKNILDILSQIEEAVEEIENLNQSETLKRIYYRYWAYQLSTLLGDVPRLKSDSDYEEIIKRCRNCAFLLKYGSGKKVKTVYTLYCVFGMKCTMHILKKYLDGVWRR